MSQSWRGELAAVLPRAAVSVASNPFRMFAHPLLRLLAVDIPSRARSVSAEKLVGDARGELHQFGIRSPRSSIGRWSSVTNSEQAVARIHA
jgi:hypothetical protein